MLFPALRRRLRGTFLGGLIGKHLVAGESLLDVGGGTGFFARWLQENADVKATLSDIVDYDASRDKSLPFIHQLDPRRIPSKDAAYDNVLVMFVLHHIDTAELQLNLVREAMRVARKRVIIVEDTPRSWWDWGMNKLFDWVLNVRHGIPTPFTFRSSVDWCSAFAAEHFVIDEVHAFRSVWPSFGIYRQSMIVLDAEKTRVGNSIGNLEVRRT